MTDEETIKHLIDTAKQFLPATGTERSEILPESMIGLWLRTAEALEEVTREMHARELHHFEEEQESARLRAALERVDTALRGDGRSAVLIVAAQEIINDTLEEEVRTHPPRRDEEGAVMNRKELIEEAAQAMSAYERNLDRKRGDESERIWGHRGAFVPGLHPTQEGRAEAAFVVFEKASAPTDDEREAITDEALWDFAGDLLDAWNIEDTNAPSMSEDFRDRFVARFHPAYHAEPPGEPSDAVVREAVSTERKAIASLLMSLGDRMTGEGTQAGYYAAAHEVRERERERAALRAAGKIRLRSPEDGAN